MKKSYTLKPENLNAIAHREHPDADKTIILKMDLK